MKMKIIIKPNPDRLVHNHYGISYTYTKITKILILLIMKITIMTIKTMIKLILVTTFIIMVSHHKYSVLFNY